MKPMLAALALVCAAVLVLPAFAVSGPGLHDAGLTAGSVQHQAQAAPSSPPSKPLTERQKREQCFVRCWHSCWWLHCVERCRCWCSDEKREVCAKMIWKL